jgi:3-oxoacyl-[acyl-carrier-protein] synthase III
MVPFRFKHVCIENFAANIPPFEVTSSQIEDKIAPLYQRLQIPFGTLEKLSGVRSRYFWDANVLPSEVATVAAKKAIEGISFDPKLIQAVFNCSVTRDYFEPATACIIHRNLGLSEDAMAMDISNACIGFSNGMLQMAMMIETGAIKAGIVTSGENISRIIDACIALLAKDETIQRDDLLRLLPTFTLGSGAVAFVMCHESISKNGHHLVGAVSRSATEHSELCSGNGDYCISQKIDLSPMMYTDSQKLMASAAKLGGRMWKDASQLLGWSKDDVDHIFCHQVGKQVNDSFYKEMGLDISKEFTVYQRYGNLVSAALPLALITGAAEKDMKTGEKVLLTAFGSGLNSIFSGIIW